MQNLGKLVLLCAMMICLAGCGGGGGSFFSSLGDAFTSGGSSGGSSGFVSGDGGSGGGGTQIAMVHNPEPATMLLWGAGLAGAVLLRKRKNKQLISCLADQRLF